MTKRVNFLTLSLSLFTATLLLAGCPADHQSDNNDIQTDSLTRDLNQTSQTQVDQTRTQPQESNQATIFLTKALQGGSTEVQMGQLALEKSQNPEVKNFAQHLIKDHSQASENVKQLASAKQLPLPIQISSEQQTILSHLSGLSGESFDKEFMKKNVQIHEKEVNEFQNQANNNPDTQVRNLAAKTLTKLQAHLKMAKELNLKLN